MIHLRHSPRSVAPLVIGAAALLSAACSSTGPDNIKSVSLSIMAKQPAGQMAARTGFSADVAVGTGANSLNITKVEFVLAQIELSQAATCSTPPANDDNCDEMQLDPLLVDLPLDGSPPKTVLDAQVPSGSYTRLQAELNAVSADEGESGDAAFLAAHPEWADKSVQVTGVYTDAGNTPHDFVFTSSIDAEIEVPFSAPVTVDATTSNFTITVDVAKWFTDAAGAAIDPTNPANADAINANIQASFGGFEDDNQNGLDDHEEGSH